MKESNKQFCGADPRLEGAELYVRPEDFLEGTIWRRMADAYGVGCVLMLAWERGGDRTYIPGYEAITHKASQRRRAEHHQNK